MGFFTAYRKFNAIWMAVILMVIGLLFAGVSGFVLLQPEAETVPVDVVITDITQTGAGEDISHTVLVSYEVDGKTYETELNAYQSGWKVGDTLTCKYEVGHPENVSYGNGMILKIGILVIGLAALAAGIVLLFRNTRKTQKDYAQYNKLDESKIDPQKRAEIENSTEAPQDYIFHYTGTLNQSFVMKDAFGGEVFRADCDGIQLFKATDYDFVNLQTGEHAARKIGHTVTVTTGNGSVLFPAMSSSFKIDGRDCWSFLADLGYTMEFSLKGLRCHYEVKHLGVSVGSVETAGTEILNEKYAGNPLAKLPAKGLYRVSCRPGEAEGFFLICFCLSKTEATVE